MDSTIVRNGIPLSEIRDSALSCKDIEKFSPYIIFAGRLDRDKGLDKLVRSFEYLKKSDLTLALVGKGEYETSLRKLVAQLGLESKVIFLGYKENPLPFIRSSLALVIPSPWECQSLAVLEAFSLSVPVIGVDNPGMRDLLWNGDRGLLCKGNATSLAKAIRKIISDNKLRSALVQAGQDYVEAHEESTMFKYYLEIIDDLIK